MIVKFLALLPLLNLWRTAEAFVGKSSTITTTNTRHVWSQRRTTRTREDCPNYATVSADDNTMKASPSGFSQPDMAAFSSAYKTVFEELPSKACTPSVGTIPADLEGTYFRCGPAMFSAGSIVPPKTSIVQPKQPPIPDGQDADRMVKHPFEGDGAMLGVTFSPPSSAEGTSSSEVTARYRFVRTIAFTKERKKGSRAYTGMDATRTSGSAAATSQGLGNDVPLPLFRHHLAPGLNKSRKNTSNTRAIYWGKRLLTLWEGGKPYKMDALALQTEGPSRLGGAIKKETDPFGGKMVQDLKNQRAIFYGMDHGMGRSELALYEFNADFRLVKDGYQKIDLPGFALVTDFAATEQYAVFLQPDVSAGLPFVVSKDPAKSLTVQPQGAATLHLIPRVGSTRKQVSLPVPVDALSEANVQFCNAYEEGDDQVIIDLIRSDGSNVKETAAASSSWPWASTLADYQATSSKKSLWRYTVNHKTGSVIKQCLSDTHCFFGTVNPAVSTQQHSYLYMNVGAMGSEVAPPQGIARLECASNTMQVWMPEPYEFCGEPIYAKRQGEDGTSSPEDAGYLLSVLYNGKEKQSELVVLLASNVSAGPIARIPLGVAIPHGLFGCFAAGKEASWSTETIERRAKLSDKIESQGNRWNEVNSDFSGLGLRFNELEEYFGDTFEDLFS